MYEGYRLAGDEDCGVSLYCRRDECWDGGRPLAYYFEEGPKGCAWVIQGVEHAGTIADLLEIADQHEQSEHEGRNRLVEQLTAIEARLTELETSSVVNEHTDEIVKLMYRVNALERKTDG